MQRHLMFRLLFILAIIAIVLPCGAQKNATPPDPWQSMVNVEVKDLPISDALQLLFKDSGINFTVSPDITQIRVSAVLKNITLQEALKAIIKATGARYAINKKIVQVSGDPAYNYINNINAYAANNQMIPQQPAAAARNINPTVGSANGFDATTANGNYLGAENNISQQKMVSKAIELKHYDAGQLAPIIANSGVNVYATNGKQSVISGPEYNVNQAADLIAAIDNDYNLPRPVRINISAKATWGQPGSETGPRAKKPVTAKMDPTISIAEGYEKEFAFTSETIPTPDSPGLNLRFKVRAQPVVMTDGRISVSGSFSFDWAIRQGNVNHSLFNSPNVPIMVSLEPGKPQNVSNISMGLGADGKEAVLDVSMTATIEKGRISPSAPMPVAAPVGGR